VFGSRAIAQEASRSGPPPPSFIAWRTLQLSLAADGPVLPSTIRLLYECGGFCSLRSESERGSCGGKAVLIGRSGRMEAGKTSSVPDAWSC